MKSITAVAVIGLLFFAGRLCNSSGDANQPTSVSSPSAPGKSFAKDYIKPQYARFRLTKSFTKEEARKTALGFTGKMLDQSRDAASATTTVVFGTWIIDLVRRELTTLDGTPVHLTRAEFDLLAALVGADGRPLSREYLIEVVSNRQTDVDVRTVDALIARLRRKLVGNRPVIATVTGVGYKLTLDERR